MKSEQGKKINKKVFRSVVEEVLGVVASDMLAEPEMLKGANEFIFYKNKKGKERESPAENMIRRLFLNYEMEKINEVLKILLGVREVVKVNKLKNEEELNRWMALKKNKNRQNLFGDSVERGSSIELVEEDG